MGGGRGELIVRTVEGDRGGENEGEVALMEIEGETPEERRSWKVSGKEEERGKEKA